MTLPLEYHILVKRAVQRAIPAFVVVLGILSFSLLLVSASAAAQVPGAPPTGVVGPPVTRGGTPPTGVTGSHRPITPPPTGIIVTHPRPGDGHRRHHDGQVTIPYSYGYVYGVPVPYAVDPGATSDDATTAPESNDAQDPEYQGGPTVFDRRGSGPDSYVRPVAPQQASLAVDSGTTPVPEVASPQTPTILVFKDGHEVEVENYAIVGPTLFDLAPSHRRKIAVADLDVVATQQKNDDRGVSFSLPASARAN